MWRIKHICDGDYGCEERACEATFHASDDLSGDALAARDVSSALALGTLGVTEPSAVAGLQRRIKENHGGLINCAELLKANAEAGGQKKPHCDAMIREAIELICEYAELK